ncbi:MAG: hypothetical protein LC664_12345 [Flavobacteriales bacterium]|nr:hypothetical protein [Flavobacteriales bacterium]
MGGVVGRADTTEQANLEIAAQKHALYQTFNTWKGENEQIDDVCILGIEIE